MAGMLVEFDVDIVIPVQVRRLSVIKLFGVGASDNFIGF
jgi:hypothetical protein